MFRIISDITGKMSAIDRYSQTRLINPESVLEHTGWVCMTCLFIATKLNEEGEGLDIGLLMSKAAIHDIEEVITGDIASPTKYFSEKLTNEIGKLSRHAVSQILKPFDSKELSDIWSKSKEGKEGFIVMLADKLAVVYKVNQEVSQFGNQTIKGHVTSLMPSLEWIRQYMELKSVIKNRKFVNEIIDEAIEICQILV